MPCRLVPVAASLTLMLAACSADRPKGLVCKGICPPGEGPVSLLPADGADTASTETASGGAAALSDSSAMAGPELAEQMRNLMRMKADRVPAGIPERALGDLPPADEGRLNVLALSSGGPFGAFGAGFLNGWSTQTVNDLIRPERFDVVTGVSAGALLATFAFLGPERDGDLEDAYTTIATEDVFTERSLLGKLFSNSLFDTAPLRETLAELVTPELLDEVAAATAVDPEDGMPRRLLLVLAVNLDSGLPRIFDLGAIAREGSDPERIERYIDALLASAAIPVAFPPVFIDGDMHVDGGARLALFFNRFMEDQRASIEDRRVLPAKLDIIVNSEVTVEPICTGNTLVGVGGRSLDVVLNQLTLDSLFRAVSEAESLGLDVRFTTAEASGCTAPDDLADPFETAFLQCLFDFGKELGSGEAPFKSGLDDFPVLRAGNAPGDPAACAPG